jgi:hypothetical protein
MQSILSDGSDGSDGSDAEDPRFLRDRQFDYDYIHENENDNENENDTKKLLCRSRDFKKDAGNQHPFLFNICK